MGISEVKLITEALITLESSENKRFSLLISPNFNALLQGMFDPTTLSYEVSITWDNQAIANFTQQLIADFPSLADHFTTFSPSQSSENTAMQALFMARLVNILTPDCWEDSEDIYTNSPVCKPIEDALRQQIAQERLLNQVIGQIRQSLDLSTILETAVRELRSFLQVDRLVIYEFGDKNLLNLDDTNLNKSFGRVTYESRLSESIPSLLNIKPQDDCFTNLPDYHKKYQQGSIVAIEDVEIAYSSSFCLIQFLNTYLIKAKLIAPIVVEGTLWGLLIAHQCFKVRKWLENEKNFLGKIGEHLAIAIYQAQLYAQVQQQKKTFEQRVIERTQELRDTLLASQAANYSKTEFLGNMSHELRTPLTCVIGLSGTLLHWSGENRSFSLEKQRQYLQTIQDSGKHLLDMINEILEFSKLQAGKCVLVIQEFSLPYIAQNVLQQVIKEAQRRLIKLELDIQINPEEDRFLADPERVKQILYHLLNNALKFTPEEGTVILRLWREGNEAIFQVEDTGIGIIKEKIPLLFESFQQLETSRRRTYGGTGLGLALTKQLVELHGGTIEVESVFREGSIFTVRLPNQPQRLLKSSNPSETEQSFNNRNRSIILIESNEEIATLIGELLIAANYQFIWLTEGGSAIQRIDVLEPSIVILDQDLTDAYKISENIKKTAETKSIKTLLLSDQISSKEWTKISQRGIDDYLLKPIQPNLLLKRINALMALDNDINYDII
ncbi:two-component sensor histidine kinase [Aphanothece sacrum FPU1]|uniref:histidine kinase n=2 Tax=Aphanothece sacrum TaxID=1122 RepID=A0A401IH00_APHSA|nr:two-component sensor histidine kinase [Aphanothece sacrum FPU1]GBF84048.1 two-component sensor histidine kinase [Aphanothece sacrum FPU3]